MNAARRNPYMLPFLVLMVIVGAVSGASGIANGVLWVAVLGFGVALVALGAAWRVKQGRTPRWLGGP